MFVLSEVKDTIKIQPRDFGIDRAQAIEDEINRRYSNKVVPGLGLCICCRDILQAGEGIVLYGDGNLYHKVVFWLVMFRPTIGEVIIGKVASSSPNHGIRVTMGFFDDIMIPPSGLPENSGFDANVSEFWWDTQDPNEPIPDDPTSTRVFVQRGDYVRMRVESESFDDSTPVKFGKGALAGTAGSTGGDGEMTNGIEADKIPSYSLVCTIGDQGLGPLGWWTGGQAQGEDAGMEPG